MIYKSELLYAQAAVGGGIVFPLADSKLLIIDG